MSLLRQMAASSIERRWCIIV